MRQEDLSLLVQRPIVILWFFFLKNDGKCRQGRDLIPVEIKSETKLI